jgi:TfoX/Sxy family transcriptional regulator of competence genes
MAFDAGLADRIRLVLPKNRAITERKMFGGLAFLMNGHMFCGIVKNDLMVRPGEELAAAALRQPHTRPMDFSGKPMKSMIYVDARGLDSDESLQSWVGMALEFARTLPPKL